MDNVYQNSANCCGCGTCMIVCPKHAISMKCDEKGFVYPTINSDICIDCGACRKACSFSKKKEKKLVWKVQSAMQHVTQIKVNWKNLLLVAYFLRWLIRSWNREG